MPRTYYRITLPTKPSAGLFFLIKSRETMPLKGWHVENGNLLRKNCHPCLKRMSKDGNQLAYPSHFFLKKPCTVVTVILCFKSPF
jgi:hypothetical protein